jgi:hypothetical protein
VPGRSCSICTQALARRYRSLNASRCRVDSLLSKQLISQRAAEQMYEGLFISAFTAMEGLVEEVFIGLLTPSLVYSHGSAKTRVSVKSPKVAREIVVGTGRRYVDWLPYERTEERAHLFFRGGRPFTNLGAADKQALLKCQVIRNAIAHRSRHSMRQFEHIVLAPIALPPRQRKPGSFLHAQFSAAPVQRWYEVLVAQMLHCARLITG